MWFASQNALLDRLVAGCREDGREVVFLVGSPLTGPVPSTGPGVPGVTGMVDLIRTAYEGNPRARESLERALAASSNRYQDALRHLLERRGPHGVEQVVRQAVLRARLPAQPILLPYMNPAEEGACQLLENDLDGWYYSPGVEALGKLLSVCQDHFGTTLLTSNFDPLIELSIRKSKGRCYATVLHGDASLEQTRGGGTHVVHFHGYWFGTDTLHTPVQLNHDRPQLRASLARLLRRCTLVVLAYGGWDDILTHTLRLLVQDQGEFLDIIWTFYESDEALITQRHAHVLTWLEPAVARGRALFYKGVDCHHFLPLLLNELHEEVTQEIPPPAEGMGYPRSPRVEAKAAHPHAFMGREQQKKTALDAVDGRQAVQLLGDRRMGKSSVLRWLQDELTTRGHRTAFVNARGIQGCTPADLVLAAADSLGVRSDVKERLYADSAVPDARAAERCLDDLGKVVLLVDEAGALASRGHRFDTRFFEAIYHKLRLGEIGWISASEQDLFWAFFRTGLESTFLRDTQRVLLGALSPEDSRAILTARLTSPELVERAVLLAGGIPLAIRWLGDALFQRPGELAKVEEEFRRWVLPLFTLWWRGLENDERQLLHRCAAESLVVHRLYDEELATAKALVDRGLLLRRGNTFLLEGVVWKAFVQDTASQALP